MNTRIFEAFEARERQVSAYMAGCGQKYGMPCTCGPDCRCSNCSEHCKKNKSEQGGQAIDGSCCSNQRDIQFSDHDMMAPPPAHTNDNNYGGMQPIQEGRDHVVARNPSIISFGGNMRHMSITSETTFGRAMSGLSALSIDWENMEDFDINVDHSAHINNGVGQDGMASTSFMGGGARRSSLRRSINAMNAAAAAAAAGMNSDSDTNHAAQVSFKV